MLIEEIHLSSFKGFKDFKLKCSQFTTLVGMNSSGKTSILQAIKLVHDFFQYSFGGYSNPDIQRPNFTDIRWSYNNSYQSPSKIINRLNSGDPDALWLNKKNVIPCQIALKLSQEIEVRLEVPSRDSYNLDLLVDKKSGVAE